MREYYLGTIRKDWKGLQIKTWVITRTNAATVNG